MSVDAVTRSLKEYQEVMTNPLVQNPGLTCGERLGAIWEYGFEDAFTKDKSKAIWIVSLLGLSALAGLALALASAPVLAFFAFVPPAGAALYWTIGTLFIRVLMPCCDGHNPHFDRWTSLHYAVNNSQNYRVKSILHNGSVDPNQAGGTSFMKAIAIDMALSIDTPWRHLSLALLLKDRRVRNALETNTGIYGTPLETAIKTGNLVAIRLLVTAGAKTDGAWKFSKDLAASRYAYAEKPAQERVQKVLLELGVKEAAAAA